MENFKVVKHLKINWLKNASENGGAMQLIINSKPKHHNVVWSKTKKFGNMWADVNNEELLKLVDKDNSIYEVITKFPHKVYFDIDADNKNYDIYEKLVPKINELFPDADLAISGSKSDVRQSYHITLNNYLINNEDERQTMKSLVKYLKLNFDDSFDDKVYTKNRNMKCVNQSKEDNRIQAIILNDNIEKHLITTFIKEKHALPKFEIVQPEISLAIEIDKTKSNKFNVGDLPKLKLEVPETIKFDINDFTPSDALKILPINKSFDHKYTHLIARYCYYNSLDFETFYSWYKNKSNKTENYKKWQMHWSHLSKFPEVNNGHITTIIMKFYPSLKREKHFVQFQELFKIGEVKKVETLSQDVFNSDVKFICLNTGMGSGKTFQTIKYLKDKESFIWITPNIALAQNTTQRLRTDGIDIAYYKDFKRTSDKIDKMPKQEKLMICINSLHYTDEKKYKVVVIDEIETVLNKWFNNTTLEKDKLTNWTRFIDILKSADKVIFLDAFTSKITTSFIESLNTSDNIINYDIIELNKSIVDRTIRTKSSFESWCGSIINSLKENKKVFVFYPFKDGNSSYPTMENLKGIFEKHSNKKGICYNGESDDSILKTLDDVNKHWNEVEFVMTNNKINVGINYEKFDFDSVYLSIAGFSSPRDIIQVSYRCRHLKSNNIYLCYLNTSTQNNVFQNDDRLVDNCTIYKNLVKHLLIEKKAPLKATFNYFCNLAHYKINYSKEILNKELDQYIKTLFDDVDLGYSYSTIKDIDSEELEELEQKVFSMTSTLDDKMAIKKYYYKRQFINKTADEVQDGWNNRYLFFFSKVKQLLYNEDNIYNKIKEENKWESIFPSDVELNKVKLSETILDQIFKEYYFKDLTKKSSARNIIKNIYNNFFGKHLIKSTRDTNGDFENEYGKHKHYALYIDDEVRNYYSFGIKNIKIYKKRIEIEEVKIESPLDSGIFTD
jgi:hypothetical protein